MKNPHYKTTLEATYSRKFACHAFMRLEEAFKNVSFDLRKSSIDGFKSFDELKAETEKLLNSGSADNERLVAEFNEVCEPIKSADNKKFEVMARVNPEGKIEIAFVDV